jgi:hypothetical protein
MAGVRSSWWLALAVTLLLGPGCTGILSEQYYEDGRTERLRLQSGDKWSNWERNPFKENDTCIMLKKELTY